MLPRIIRANSACSRRMFSYSSIRSKGSFSSPDEFMKEKRDQDIQEHEYRQHLLANKFNYEPKYISENEANPNTNRPVPLNVELLKYQPMTLPQTHGNEVAKLSFRSYSEDSLLRASEFAGRAAFYLGIPCTPVIRQKTEKRLYTVIRSPFAQAKSKENFHRVTYKCHLKAYDANPDVVDLWLSYINKYAFEDVEVKGKVHSNQAVTYSEDMAKLSAEQLRMPDGYKDVEDPVANKVQEILGSEDFKKFFKESSEVKEVKAKSKKAKKQ